MVHAQRGTDIKGVVKSAIARTHPSRAAGRAGHYKQRDKYFGFIGRKPGPDVTTRSFGAACARADGPGKAALFSVHKFVGARQVRPRPVLWGPHLERLALAGPIPEPHAP